MGGIPFVFTLISIFLFTFIFWFLIFLTRYFFNTSNSFFKYSFYECGFKAYENVDIKLNSSTTIISIFLILYEVEFMLLLPFFLLIYNLSFIGLLILILILIIIGILLYVDNVFLLLFWNN